MVGSSNRSLSSGCPAVRRSSQPSVRASPPPGRGRALRSPRAHTGRDRGRRCRARLVDAWIISWALRPVRPGLPACDPGTCGCQKRQPLRNRLTQSGQASSSTLVIGVPRPRALRDGHETTSWRNCSAANSGRSIARLPARASRSSMRAICPTTSARPPSRTTIAASAGKCRASATIKGAGG